MGADEPIEVYECPWPDSKIKISLEDATAKFINLAAFFLRLLEHLPKDNDGLVSDETLAYCEWRYIVYLRFLHFYGLTPCERPPPWDVAMLMSCHLASPALLHQHLAVNGHTSFGLVHAHFPLLTLLSLVQAGRWSHKKTQRDWERFDSRRKAPPYRLSYQLWPTAPWEMALSSPSHSSSSVSHPSSSASGRSGIFKRLVSGLSLSPQRGGGRLHKPLVTVGGHQHTVPGVHMSREREGQCMLTGKPVYTVDEYAKLRSANVDQLRKGCQQYPRHLTYNEGCGLAPWPTVHHLKAALYNQVALWTAITKADTMTDSIVPRLATAVGNYRRFIQLFAKEIYEAKARSRKTLDPMARAREPKTARDGDEQERHGESERKRSELIPPTLEVSLLWHVHRLFPGTYWAWCTHEVRQLIDGNFTPSAEPLYAGLAETHRRWDILFPDRRPFEAGSQATEKWAGVYRPDVAVVGPAEGVRFTSLGTVIRGYAPWRKGKTPPPSRRKRDNGQSSGVGDGGYGYSGDGGDGGGGGGGGGDGGGC